MDDEEEKKQRSREWGSSLGNFVQIIKYLKNPIVIAILTILPFIIVGVGAISYITSIPATAAGHIAELLEKLTNAIKPEGTITVTNDEILDLCKYLEEEMGYDLAAYGFVEEITRSGGTGEQDSSGNVTRGKIQSVKSKYLQSYIIADKKTYAISNPKNAGADLEIFDYNISKTSESIRIAAIEEAFDEYCENNSTIQNAFNLMYSHDGSTYTLRNDINELNKNSNIYKKYATMSRK